ncbi:AAA family ATPase [Longispora sp. NPDC051575]|uniref:helix-turn-helix transcriptional regulator n=1 Tax=Longispora sp. NPDC051575 TaxID=3154943 RepID=UPI0034297E56
MLHGRTGERTAIDRLLADCRAGTSGALLLSGDPGIGKTALLRYATEHAADLRLLRGTGIESEAELPFAGLHMVLRPVLDRLDSLPGPQRAALRGAFGLDPDAPPKPQTGGPTGREPGVAAGTSADPVPEHASREPADRLLTSLAVLTLLSELGPVLCVVDDAQWLDRASAEVLLFAARRLDAEGVGLLLAARPEFTAPGVPSLVLTGLAPEASAALLDEREPGLAPTVRYRVLAESVGNPLALLELPAALTSEPTAPGALPSTVGTVGSATLGVLPSPGTGTPGALPLTGRLQDAFHAQVARLPAATRTLLLIAAADDTGDPGLILRAGATLGAGLADVAPAEHLVDEGSGTVAFRHPLVRAAVYQGAALLDRIAAHRALADALDGEDADRRAWHLAAAATGPDEQVAAALERSAERSRSRSGHAAATTAYERAARLSADRSARGERLTLAAESAVDAGDLDEAGRLADEAAGALPPERSSGSTRDAGAVRAAGHTRLALLRGTVGFWRGDFRAAHQLLVTGAETAGDREHAARMLVQAFHTAWYTDEATVVDVVARLNDVSASPVTRFLTAAMSPLTGRPVPVGDTLDAALRAVADSPRDLAMVLGGALVVGRDDVTHREAAVLAAAGRAEGRCGLLPTVLFFLAEGELFAGRHAEATATAREAVRIAEDTGQRQWLSQVNALLAYLAAIRGDEDACQAHAAAARRAEAGGPWTDWALGMLDLGLGRVEAALVRFEALAGGPLGFHVSATRCVPDLVEAAVRLGRPERARAPLARFERWAAHTGQPWAQALVHRCHALLTSDEAAYEAALGLPPAPFPLDRHALADQARTEQAPAHATPDRHPLPGLDQAPATPGRHAPAGPPPTGRPFEQARTDLLYGEWLRRGRRKAEARPHLRTAMEVFELLGATPWADRARAELTATGEHAPAHPTGPLSTLTPQELAIVQLAAGGLSNRDIAARLFLSPRTVGHHLYKAYPKLGILSRSELTKLVA